MITRDVMLRILRNALDHYDPQDEGLWFVSTDDPEDIGFRVIASTPGQVKVFRVEVTGEG